MAKEFRPVAREQRFLLPPDMADWLPDDHLVWFVLDTVTELDTSALRARAARRRDGAARRSDAGRAAYDPDMLAGLLLYAYCRGQRSSREIERLCRVDVAFRIACAGDIPDHTVIARFRQAHQEAFAGVFTQVLRLCRQAGMARLGTVAIDGSKIAADASRQANRDRDGLLSAAERAGDRADRAGDRAVVDQILVEAGEVDAAEDAAHGPEDPDGGDGGGDRCPPGWGGRDGRRERIRAALARVEQIEAGRSDTAEQSTRASAERAARWADRDARALSDAQTALQEQITAQQARIDAYQRAYQHGLATGGPLPHGRAPRPIGEDSRVQRARARVAKAQHRLDHPDTVRRPGGNRRTSTRPGRARDTTPRANTTDPDSSLMPSKNGWVQGYNVQFAVTADQIILATAVTTSPVDILSYAPMVAATEHAAEMLGATTELGTLLFDTGYCSDATLSDATLSGPGPDRLIALGKTHSVRAHARDHPATGEPAPEATPRQQMDHRLRTPDGARLYTRRGATVEPGIGNFKKILHRVSRRGLAAATHEIELAATAFNLLKLHRAPAPA